MNARSVLEKATAQGAILFVAEGKIRGRGPKPCAAFLSELRQHEAELVSHLGGSEPTAKLPVVGFGGRSREHIPENEAAHHAAPRIVREEPGFEHSCAARRGRVEERDGGFVHFCAE